MLCEEHTFGAKEFILVGVVGPFTLFCIFLDGRREKPSVRKLSVSQVANIKIGLQFHTKLDNIERKPSAPCIFHMTMLRYTLILFLPPAPSQVMTVSNVSSRSTKNGNTTIIHSTEPSPSVSYHKQNCSVRECHFTGELTASTEMTCVALICMPAMSACMRAKYAK